MKDFSQSDLRGRSTIVYEFSRRLTSLSPAQKARLLTFNAIRLGLIQPRAPVKGENIRTWINDRDGRKIQAWVLVSAIDCLIRFTDWLPTQDDDFACWSYSMSRLYQLIDKPVDFIPLFPPGIDEALALRWLSLALDHAKPFRHQRYRLALNSLDDKASDAERVKAVLIDKFKPCTEFELAFTAFGAGDWTERLQRVVEVSSDIVVDHVDVDGRSLPAFEQCEMQSQRFYSLR